MNILPKKSWHVRNRDNIARVKRDEALAAEEEKKKEARIALAEQETRTELLRIKAKEKYGSRTGLPSQGPDSGSQHLSQQQTFGQRDHINFFSELEAGNKSSTTNKDHEAEKKKEQEDYEKKIGLLVGLGQSSSELAAVKPWYQQVREKEQKSEEKDADKNDLKRKAAMDPMNDMMRYLGKKPKKGPESKSSKLKEDSKPNNSAAGGLPGTSSMLTLFSKYREKEKEVKKMETQIKKHKDKKRVKHKKHKKLKLKSRTHHRKKSKQRDKDKDRKENRHKKHKRRSSYSEDSDSDSTGDDQNRDRTLSRNRKSHHRKRKRKGSHKKYRHDSSSEDGSYSSESNSFSNSSHSDMDSSSSSAAPKETSKPGPTIEQLRAERLRREAAERTKTERLLSGQPLEDAPPAQPQITDKLDGKYNSQFNPHLARKRQPKAPLF